MIRLQLPKPKLQVKTSSLMRVPIQRQSEMSFNPVMIYSRKTTTLGALLHLLKFSDQSRHQAMNNQLPQPPMKKRKDLTSKLHLRYQKNLVIW
jgi:hypothetical protein